MGKLAKKLAKPEKIPQPNGKGALYAGGVPGHRGGGGRPPDEFKKLCQELASGEKTVESIRKILDDKDHSQFMAAVRWASEHGYGKPSQPLDIGVQDSLAALLTR